MNTRLMIVSMFIMSGLVFASCQAAPAAMESMPGGAPMYDESVQKEYLEEQVSVEREAAPNYEADYTNSNTGNAEYAVTERIVIMNADLSVVVDDPAEKMTTITRMAEDMKGFVVTSNLFKTFTSNGLEVPQASITIRVPSEQLYDALDKIKALADNPDSDIRYENVSGQDVTREYTDLQSRLKNQEMAAEQLSTIMEEAKRTEDVLAVYNELVRVTEEIEILKGQINYYKEASALSAISIELVAQEMVEPLSVAGWEPVGVARDAVQALINALEFIVEAGIWIIIFFLPVAVIILAPFVVIGLLIRRYAQRRKARKSTDPEKAAEAASEPGSLKEDTK
jgi:hypothetical protein